MVGIFTVRRLTLGEIYRYFTFNDYVQVTRIAYKTNQLTDKTNIHNKH